MTAPNEKPRALIVDDSAVDLEIISLVCGALGCEVDLASDGPTALELFKQNTYHLVLTDYSMKPMNGIDLVLQLKQIDSEINCLLITGAPNADVRHFATEGLLVDLITKPIHAPQLREALRLALNKSKGATEKVSGIALSNRMDQCPGLGGDGPNVRSLRHQVADSITSQKPLLIVDAASERAREIAKFIHQNGPCAARAVVEVPCSCMDDAILSEKLIGEDGRWGSLLSEAESSTLILDQITMLPLRYQKILAEHFSAIASKMMIVALSDISLEDALERGQIDDDFYFKLSMDKVELSPSSLA